MGRSRWLMPRLKRNWCFTIRRMCRIPKDILAGFRKKYPFVEVETYRASGEKLIQRITTEARAGKHLSDAYLLSGFQTWLLKSMGLLSPYPSPEREKVLAALKDSGWLLDGRVLEPGGPRL